jgi:hypothetical protein
VSIEQSMGEAVQAERKLATLQNETEAMVAALESDPTLPPEGRRHRIRETRAQAEARLRKTVERGDEALIEAMDKVEKARRSRHIPESKRAEAERLLDRSDLGTAFSRAEALGDPALVKAVGEAARTFVVEGQGGPEFPNPAIVDDTVEDILRGLGAADEPARLWPEVRQAVERLERRKDLAMKVISGDKRGASVVRLALGHAESTTT